MADYDKFNPDVPDVAPGNYNVTRPIDQPKANTALGGLFDSVGKGLKDAGEIVKDATKLSDFTNKEFLSNSISLDLNAQRDRHIVDLEEKNISLQGGQNADGSPPIGLQGLPGKVNTLAAAKAQNKVDDVYFRGRVDDLSKQYRAAYPGYRDYIDATFSKAGFGQPANAYMSALEQANQGLQAALGTNKNKTLDMLYTHAKEIPNSAGLIDDLQSGRKSESQINHEIMPVLNQHYNVEARQQQLGLNAKNDEEFKRQGSQFVTNASSGDLATYFKNPDTIKILNQIEAWSQPGAKVDPVLAEQYSQKLSTDYTRLRSQAFDRDSREHNFTSSDENGNVVPSGQKYTNRGVLGEAYVGTVDKAYQPLTDIINRLQQGDHSLIKVPANIVQAGHDQFSQYAFRESDIGKSLEALHFFQGQAPEWYRTMASTFFADTQGKPMTAGVKGLIQGYTLEQMHPTNPTPVVDQQRRLQDAGINRPEINRGILTGGPKVIQDSKAPEEAKKSVVKSYFGSTNPSITDAMALGDKVKTYSAMTSKPMVESIAKLPDVNKGQYFDWVTTEFSKNLSAEIGQLPSYTERGPTASTPYRIHWNDQTHQFGIDVKGNSNLQDVDNLNKIDWHYVHGGPPGYGNSGEIKNIVGAVKRINVGLTGLKNMADVSGIDPNAYLIHQLQNSGLTDNKFWDAVKTQATAMRKDQEKPSTQ